jgi:hypothetical protein
VGNPINLLDIFHSDWYSLSKVSSVSLYSYFFHSFSRYSPVSGGGYPGPSERGPSWLATASTTGSSGVFHPESWRLDGAAGRHGFDALENMPLWRLGWAGKLLDTLIDCLLVVYLEIPRGRVYKASLKCIPAHSFEVRAVQDDRQVVSIRKGRRSELSVEQTVRSTGRTKSLTTTIWRTSG